MKPDSLKHKQLSEATPGDDETERGTIECANCGYEFEANRAAVVVAEEYTCPECDNTHEFDNHLGGSLLLVVLVAVAAPFYLAYHRLRQKLSRLTDT